MRQIFGQSLRPLVKAGSTSPHPNTNKRPECGLQAVNCPGLRKMRKILFFQTNASQPACLVSRWSRWHDWPTATRNSTHRLYSSYLAPSNYFLFKNFRNYLREGVIRQKKRWYLLRNTYFEEQNLLFYSNGMRSLDARWKILDVLSTKGTVLNKNVI